MRLRLSAALLASLSVFVPAARAQVTVSVVPSLDRRPISPLIYGMNYASPAQQAAARVPLTRWGGNQTSRYNWLIDVTNVGNDYYFENVAGCWSAGASWCSSPPADPKETSGANAFLAAAAQAQMTALFTIPTIGWVAKAAKYAHPFDCGCPKSLIPNQDGFDMYDSNCGNCKSGGKWVVPPPPTTTSTAVDPAAMGAWVSYLVNRFGPSNGRRIYALDNEPNLWSSTHHDVHPAPLTYNELWQRMRDYAVAILAADPTAEIAGPAEWGWPNYFCSDADDINKGCSPASPDRAQHGGQELVAWLLDQAAAYEKANGKRILHYLDLHYYPQGGNPPANTRSLWDPSYTDPSWIGDKIRLIPRMRDWVGQHYPGTKTMISEYDFYQHDTAAGAIAYAEVLGIFGREGLDAATAWSPPAPTDAAFGAYKLFRNYDGAGSGFESTSVRATVMGAGVMAFAAAGANRLTVALVNETNAAQNITVSADFSAATARWYTGNGATITRQADPGVGRGTSQVTLPATSFGMLVFDGEPLGGSDLGAGPVDLGAAADSAQSGDSGPSSDSGGMQTPPANCSCRLGDRRAEPPILFVLVGGALLVLRRRRALRDQ